MIWISVDKVFFVRLKEPIHNYNSIDYSFFWNALFTQSTHIITMTHDRFIRLTKTIGKKESLICINNPGRCGGTLLSRLVQERFENVISLNEQDTLLSFLELRPVIDKQKLTDLFDATLTFLRKPYHGFKISAYVLKLSSGTCALLNDDYVNFPPDVCQIYLTRQPKPMLQSWRKVLSNMLQFEHNHYQDQRMGKVIPYKLSDAAYRSYPNFILMGDTVNQMQPRNASEYVILRWAILHSSKVISETTEKIKFTNLTYEAMIKNNEKTMAEIEVATGLRLLTKMKNEMNDVINKDSQHDHSFNKKWTDPQTKVVAMEWKLIRQEFVKNVLEHFNLENHYTAQQCL